MQLGYGSEGSDPYKTIMAPEQCRDQPQKLAGLGFNIQLGGPRINQKTDLLELAYATSGTWLNHTAWPVWGGMS
jgi:hypothetical protein